jgi:hypothetical protein
VAVVTVKDTLTGECCFIYPHVLLCGSCGTIYRTISSSAGVQQVRGCPLSIDGIGRTFPLFLILWSSQWNRSVFRRQCAEYLSVYSLAATLILFTACTKHQVHITKFILDVIHLIIPSLLMDYCHVWFHSTNCALPWCWLLTTVVSIVCGLHLY